MTFVCRTPDSLISIGEEAFAGCTELGQIKLPFNLESIGDGAFRSCSKLEQIELPHKLETIGMQAFEVTSINSITIPASIKNMRSLGSLESMTFLGDCPEGVGYGTFSDVDTIYYSGNGFDHWMEITPTTTWIKQ